MAVVLSHSCHLIWLPLKGCFEFCRGENEEFALRLNLNPLHLHSLTQKFSRQSDGAYG